MQIVRNVERTPAISRPVMTIGNFDGVHLGHQALLEKVIEDAESRGGASVVLTFDPHPLKILAPRVAPRLILALRDRLVLLRKVGIDVTIIQRFTPAFYNLAASEFVRRYVSGIGTRSLWVGRDFRFGKGRAGNVDNLVSWGRSEGFEVKIVEEVVAASQRISSSRIRHLIDTGEVAVARRYLGRCHFIRGRVVRGHQRGRGLGFPTANLATRSEVVPADGIYASFVEFGGESFPSVTSIGWNPTFGEGCKTIETHILGFNGDLYGRSLCLFFVERIRGEKKFDSVDLLVAQIRQDIVDARRAFKRAVKDSPALLDMLDKAVHFT